MWCPNEEQIRNTLAFVLHDMALGRLHEAAKYSHGVGELCWYVILFEHVLIASDMFIFSRESFLYV